MKFAVITVMSSTPQQASHDRSIVVMRFSSRSQIVTTDLSTSSPPHHHPFHLTLVVSMLLFTQHDTEKVTTEEKRNGETPRKTLPFIKDLQHFHANERQVYISVGSNGSNDNYWQQSPLARLHHWASLQWVSLQMCQRQFMTMVQNDFLYLACMLMHCSLR